MSSSRPVDAIDAMWLHMDTPTNPMVIEGVMWSPDNIELERAVKVLEERLPGRYPVFRQRPVRTSNPLQPDMWEDATDWAVRDNVTEVKLPKLTHESIQAYVSERMGQPMDKTKPLWTFDLVTGPGNGTAVVTRMHHAIADGTALVRVLLELTDAEPDGDSAHKVHHREKERSNISGISSVLPSSMYSFVRRANGFTRSALRAGAKGLAAVPVIATDPSIAVDLAGQVISTSGKTTLIARKLLLTTNPESPFRGDAGTSKIATWSEAIPLTEIRAIGRHHHATVNDVLLAALGGSLRRYAIDHGFDPVDLPTMVPVNLRDTDKPLPAELGNGFALVLFALAVEPETPKARLKLTKQRMDLIKDSPEAVLTFGINKVIGSMDPRLGRTFVDFFGSKATGVTTNVPGPKHTRYFAGARLDGILGWAPGAGDQSLFTTIFSYDGHVRVGFKTDSTLVPDPQAIVAGFHAELADLLDGAPKPATTA
jgi:WS/DGAT/MGAT family acyltransferase